MNDFPDLVIPPEAAIALAAWLEWRFEQDRLLRLAQKKAGVVEHTTPAVSPTIDKLPSLYTKTASDARGEEQ